MPVTTGRTIVAVAVTVEMGSAKARTLYSPMLYQCQHPAPQYTRLPTHPEVMMSPVRTCAQLAKSYAHSSSDLTSGTTSENSWTE